MAPGSPKISDQLFDMLNLLCFLASRSASLASLSSISAVIAVPRTPVGTVNSCPKARVEGRGLEIGSEGLGVDSLIGMSVSRSPACLWLCRANYPLFVYLTGEPSKHSLRVCADC